METDISLATKKSSDVSVIPSTDDISYEAQQIRVMTVAELMEKGKRNTSALQAALKELGLEVSRPTVIKYRNAALDMIAEETKPMNRDHLRNLEIGRLNYWIDHITNKINGLDWSVLDDNGTPLAFDMFNKLMQRLKDQSDLLHKITGLNTEVNISIEEKRRIVFIRPQGSADVKTSQSDAPINSNDNNDHIIDGQVITSQ